jgi:hypothetical protein
MTKKTETNSITQKNGKDFASSTVKSFTYNPDAETLEVTFTNKQSYRYLEVSQRTANALVKADSKGSFINEKVKDKYSFERV